MVKQQGQQYTQARQRWMGLEEGLCVGDVRAGVHGAIWRDSVCATHSVEAWVVWCENTTQEMSPRFV